MEYSQAVQARCNNIFHMDMAASMEETKATATSTAKVSQTLQTNLVSTIKTRFD